MKEHIVVLTAVIFVICTLLPADQNHVQTVSAMLNSRLFHLEEDMPTNALKDLLGVMNVQHDGTRASIVRETQSLFFKNGFECHQIKENTDYALKKKSIIPCFERLGMLQEIEPHKQQYEACVVLDAHYVDWMRERLAYLSILVQQGVQFKKLYVCAGDHPIYRDECSTEESFFTFDSPQLPLKKDFKLPAVQPMTELGMIQMLLDQVRWPAPLATLIDQKKWVFSPFDKTTNRRPTTESNAQDFMIIHEKEEKHECSDYFILTNQPHVGYQHAVFLTQLLDSASNITFETGGAQDVESLNMAQHLDRFARWVYQENKLLNKIYAMQSLHDPLSKI